jgi:hypothetical protein
MAVEFAPVHERGRVAPISWPAVFASLAVGISVMLLLTLAGVAVGISVVEPGADSPRAITIGAAAWQTVSMLIAALVGGYVAARLSGLRRSADGLLHGAVAWGATTVLYAALATTALGTLTAGMFGLLTPGASERAAPTSSVSSIDREQAQRTLESIGLTSEQARTVIDQLTANPQTGANAPAAARPQVEEMADTVGTATGWLSATVLLSLVLSLGGGAIGVRGNRRGNRRIEAREAAVTTAATPASPPGVLSRQT